MRAPARWAPATRRQMSRRSTFSPETGAEALCSPKWRKTRTLREHPPAPPPCRSTFPSLAPTGPTEATTHAFSEGEPGADPPAWVFERSLEGESEIPRVSEGTDAGANARWSSTGLPRAHHRAGAGPSASLAPAPRRQMSRRSTFSPGASADVLCPPKWRKTRTLREHPPTPPPRWPRLQGGRCRVARLFRQGPVRTFSAHRSGEKLERSASIHRPLRLVRDVGDGAWAGCRRGLC